MMSEKRFRSRNKVWPESEYIIKYRDLFSAHSNTIEMIKGNIDNLGSQGMFIKTSVSIPINTKLEIFIDFNPGGVSDISLKAEGVVLRAEQDGLAVRFTKIDTQELGDCIMKKINSQTESMGNRGRSHVTVANP